MRLFHQGNISIKYLFFNELFILLTEAFVLKKGLWILVILFLVACQKDEVVNNENVKDVQKLVDQVTDTDLVNAEEDNFVTYEWKTTYAYILEQYINSYGFLDSTINPFSENTHGIIATKLFTAQNRNIPYLAILFAPEEGNFNIPSFNSENLNVNEGIYLHLWDFKNGEPTVIYQKNFTNNAKGNNLGVSIVETSNGETMIRYTTKNSEKGTFIEEEYYHIADLEKPVYKLVGNIEIGQEPEYMYGETKITNDEYLAHRQSLNYQEVNWIESTNGKKSISADVTPSIENILTVLESFNTDSLQAPNEVLPIEKQAIFNKLLQLQLIDENLTDKEKLEFASMAYLIKGGKNSADYISTTFPKLAIDYYSESNFDFVFNEKQFSSTFNSPNPAFSNGSYIFSTIGDISTVPIYTFDILNVEKLEETLYRVDYIEYYFDEESYVNSGFENIHPKYHSLQKSQWPKETFDFMINEQTRYAIFKKNKYSFALVERSPSTIQEQDNYYENNEEEIVDSSYEDKIVYLQSLNYAYKLLDAMYSDTTSLQTVLKAHNAWDYELNRIYALLKQNLPTEVMNSLKQEQRNWIKVRDTNARKPEEIGEYRHWEIKTIETLNRTNYLIDLYFDY